MRAHQIKKLAELVSEATDRIASLTTDNLRLRQEVARVESLCADMELKLKRLGHLGSRQERLRGRLERALTKLDKAAELAG